MLLREVGDLAENIELCPLHDLSIWGQDVETISKVTLMVTFSILSTRFSARLATTVLNDLAAEYQMQSLMGDAPENFDIEEFRPPTRPILLREIKDMLEGFSDVERRAILFSLSAGISIDTTIRLARKDPMLKKVTDPTALSILKSCIPNLQCDRLFWQMNLGKVESLINLPGEFLLSAGMSWTDFSRSAQKLLSDDQVYPKLAK